MSVAPGRGSARRGGRRAPTAFATTVDYADHAQFESRATRITGPGYGSGGLLPQLRALVAIVAAALSEPALLLDSSAGSLHPDVLACALIGLLPRSRRARVVLMGCMWERSAGWRGRVERLVVRVADHGIDRYALQTTDELRTFPATWGIAPGKLRFCPYFATMEAEALDGALDGGHVFAGGNSHRDYGPLVEAARRFPDTPFILATHLLEDRDLPRNVVASPVPEERFADLMRTARIVVVPMRAGLVRGTGQQTYLNAMAMGKAVVVTDVAGVRGYLDDGATGVVVDGSADGYAGALERLLSSPAVREEMGARARAAARERYTYRAHVDRLLEILDD